MIKRTTDAAEVARRIAQEAAASGHPEMAIGEGAVQASMGPDDFFYIDDGKGGTLGRVVIWFHVERKPVHVYVQHVWGPSAIHPRLLRWLAQEIVNQGFGAAPVTYPRAGTPLTNVADSLATVAGERGAREATTTAAVALARLKAAGVQVVS